MTLPPRSILALAALLLTLAACGRKDSADIAAPVGQAKEQTDRKLTGNGNGIDIEEGGRFLLPRQPLPPFERHTVLDQSRNHRTKDRTETTQIDKQAYNALLVVDGIAVTAPSTRQPC